jgi:hypothetical protein
MRAFLAAREAHDVSIIQRLLPLGSAQCGLPGEDDDPLLVRMVRVVRPEPVAGLELVHAPAD